MPTLTQEEAAAVMDALCVEDELEDLDEHNPPLARAVRKMLGKAKRDDDVEDDLYGDDSDQDDVD
jgi:hypothetical protein